MRVLLADDSRGMRGVFRQVLERLGCPPGDIAEAQDGSEAVAALKSGFAPGLVVFDWELPGLAGPGLLRHLRDAGLSGKTRVLFIAGRQDRPAVARQAGGCDVLERPFSDEDFAAKIRDLGLSVEIRKHESSKSLYAIAPLPEVDRARPFLGQLEQRVLSDLLAHASAARHDAGSVLLRAGEVCGALHLVTDGRVEILAGAAGTRARVVEAGDPYGELSFMTARPSPETARALTRVQTASLSKSKLSELLRAQPALAGYLSALVARHKKALAARATTLEHSDFKGTFDTFPFADVMQMLISTRKTGVLGLRSDEDRGAIYLEDGEALHAWTETLKGEPAFLELAGWSKAKFAFTSIQRTEPRTLPRPTITLLMKAMRPAEERLS